jgi:hypothetical protein
MDEHKHRHLHLGALILVILIVFVLFKVNLEKALNSPQFQSNIAYIEKKANSLFDKMKGFFSFTNSLKIDQSTIEKKIQPGKIYDYFSVPSDETLDKLSSPIGN